MELWLHERDMKAITYEGISIANLRAVFIAIDSTFLLRRSKSILSYNLQASKHFLCYVFHHGSQKGKS